MAQWCRTALAERGPGFGSQHLNNAHYCLEHLVQETQHPLLASGSSYKHVGQYSHEGSHTHKNQ